MSMSMYHFEEMCGGVAALESPSHLHQHHATEQSQLRANARNLTIQGGTRCHFVSENFQF